MKFYVKNINLTISICSTIWKSLGFLYPPATGVCDKIFYNVYWISWFMFLVGAPVITQGIAILKMWGDIISMTSASCLCFTNISLAIKMINMVIWRHTIQEINDASDEELSALETKEEKEIIKSCNRVTSISWFGYMPLAIITCIGWTASAEKGQLPLTAWYPYDTTTSPSYEVTYFFQGSSLIVSAFMNVSFDNLIAAMIAVCCCRLRLVGLSLKNLCSSLGTPEKLMLSEEDEKLVKKRIQECVLRHEAALDTANKIQVYFAVAIIAQFSVTIFVICVTEYQLALEVNNKNWVRIISMIAYFHCMTIEVFLYCYQGNKLSETASDLSEAAYCCPWYMCSVPLRRSLQIIMVRTCYETKLTAAGITTLSLSVFASIIKASYTFFTVLNQAEGK